MGLRLSAQARREVIQRMAPQYQQVSVPYKGMVLDEVVATTGYARRSAMRLLNHPPQGSHQKKRRRQPHYGPEVQHVLFLLWHQANRICSKRLMPFLPTLIQALERHHHLRVSEDCRSQLLSMSAATADRLLRSQRERGLRGPCTTRAGTWLKQHIPLRTYQQWNETQPGFLEADLVAHCGREAQGSFLYTLTLTDIATAWTECLPLRSKSAEEVVSAFHTARVLFPFPVLGLDADNGSEFINESLLTYCEKEGLTFTRGRPDLKNDQCFVEQKNGVMVRQVVGHERLEGEQVYQQLGEVYQALRLYVNCFQPSIKLQAKQSDGKKVRRIYDAAKTPLQRLFLSQALSAAQQREVVHMAQMLDPLRLFEHLQELQRALFEKVAVLTEGTSQRACLSFCLQRCTADLHVASTQTVEGAWQKEAIPASIPSPYKPEREADSHVPCSGTVACTIPDIPCQHPREERSLPAPSSAEREAESKPRATSGIASQISTGSGDGHHQTRSGRANRKRSGQKPSDLTIEQAIQDYLVDQRGKHRRPKTLEWHEVALGSFRHYLLTEHHCIRLCQITQTQVSGWLAFLQEQPTVIGSLRSTSTTESYARSARAFCQWTVRHKYLSATPFAHLSLPQVEYGLPALLEQEEWDRLLRACRPPKGTGESVDRATARNRAILWVLFDTGMQASEVCRLCLCDVDREQGVLLVQGKGSKQRRLTLGQEGLRHLLVYLDGYRLRERASGEWGWRSDEPLFLSETGHPLTKSGVTLLFGRLRQRTGITRKVTASLLRKSFALRYLRAGGDVSLLPEVLGQQDCSSVNSFLHTSDEVIANEKRKECPEGHRRFSTKINPQGTS